MMRDRTRKALRNTLVESSDRKKPSDTPDETMKPNRVNAMNISVTLFSSIHSPGPLDCCLRLSITAHLS